jgi:hypothetical protein
MESALDQFLKLIPLRFLIQIDELLSYGINVTVYNGQVSNSLQLQFLRSPATQNYSELVIGFYCMHAFC